MTLFATATRFLQAFLSGDFDLNGNRVSVAEYDLSTGDATQRPFGRLNDPSFLYVDVGLGHRLYRNEAPDAYPARRIDGACRCSLQVPFTAVLGTACAPAANWERSCREQRIGNAKTHSNPVQPQSRERLFASANREHPQR